MDQFFQLTLIIISHQKNLIFNNMGQQSNTNLAEDNLKPQYNAGYSQY